MTLNLYVSAFYSHNKLTFINSFPCLFLFFYLTIKTQKLWTMPGLREKAPGIVTKEGQNMFLHNSRYTVQSLGQKAIRYTPVKGLRRSSARPRSKGRQKDNFIGQNKIKREVLY